MLDPVRQERRTASATPITLALYLIVGGGIGLWAAFQLTIEKFQLLADPTVHLACDYSILVGCSTNLSSWQGELFGFPNSLLGIAGWPLVFGAGAAILAGARFSRWFWITMSVGMTVAFALILFFMYESFFVLDVLCPRCMVTWAVVIPVLLAVVFSAASGGHLGGGATVRRVGAVVFAWIIPLSVGVYILAAIVAQVQMDFLHRL